MRKYCKTEVQDQKKSGSTIAKQGTGVLAKWCGRLTNNVTTGPELHGSGGGKVH